MRLVAEIHLAIVVDRWEDDTADETLATIFTLCRCLGASFIHHFMLRWFPPRAAVVASVTDDRSISGKCWRCRVTEAQVVDF